MTTHAPTAIRIDPKLRKRIKKLADKRGESPHSYMLRVLAESVERAETREEWLQSGLEAKERFERTRMAISMDDMHDWLRRTARGEKVPPPKARYVPRKGEK